MMIKDAKGYIKTMSLFKTIMDNGYDLILTHVQVDKEGGVIKETEYWATEDGLRTGHEAFARFIKDFGIPNKHVIVVDREAEYMTVHKVYIFLDREVPVIEIEFT